MKNCCSKLAASCLAVLCIGAASSVHAQLTWSDVLQFKPPAEAPLYADSLRAKGVADECFNGIGVDYPPINPDGTCNVGVPKKNLAYIWGLTQAGTGDSSFVGDAIWFGTVANPLCEGGTGVFDPEPQLTVSWVCEYGQSEQARRAVKPVPAVAGDYRVPHAYSYNVTSGQLTDRTPKDSNFKSLTGIRSAGSLGNAVLMAGPTLQNNVIFVAWDGASGSYRGSCRATALNNIRQWVTVNGTLYAAAGRASGDGVILRWTGTVDQPFNGSSSDYCGLEVVGTMPGFPAQLTAYDSKRLVASAWNSTQQPETKHGVATDSQITAGIYIGPLFGASGHYTSADAGKPWVRIWNPIQYETDPIVASTIGGGAITFWQGYLWFGTIHNTLGTVQTHSSCTLAACYGVPANQSEQTDLLFNVSRAVSIWRAKLTRDGKAQVELLYGETELPALVPGTKTFEMKSTGWTPRFGPSGFGNPFLTYAWAASAGPNDLLFGLYDYRYVFDVRIGLLTADSAAPKTSGKRAVRSSGRQTTVDPARGYGGDLWRFDSADTSAKPETVSGFGNFTNYGIRTLLRFDNSSNLFVGTASGLNLEPAAGWELHFLQAPTR